MQKLEAQQIDANLAELAEWSLNGDALQRTFRFDDFIGAMAFVSRIADLAEEMQHHPDIMIRYNKVTLTLTTHDAAGLTENDFSFARATDGYVPAVRRRAARPLCKTVPIPSGVVAVQRPPQHTACRAYSGVSPRFFEKKCGTRAGSAAERHIYP